VIKSIKYILRNNRMVFHWPAIRSNRYTCHSSHPWS